MCKEGVVRWTATLEGPTPQESGINRGSVAESVAGLDDQHFEVFRKIFELTKFSGPACINFKIVEGKPVIFEINPRFGGSLFRPRFRTQLLEALRTLIQHASPTIASSYDS